MTPQQFRAYRDAMFIGRTRGIAGPTWTCYRPSGNGVTGAVTFTNEGARTGYIVEMKLSEWGQPVPPQPVGFIPFKFVAPIGTDVRVGDVWVSGTNIFLIGTLDILQGFPTGIVSPTGMPVVVTFYILLETGDSLLLETGDHLLLEAA